MSRRDGTKVARHKMPGKDADMIRLRRGGCDRRRQVLFTTQDNRTPSSTHHTVPYGTGSVMPRFQAFHAWLPSFRPSGTIHLQAHVERGPTQPVSKPLKTSRDARKSRKPWMSFQGQINAGRGDRTDSDQKLRTGPRKRPVFGRPRNYFARSSI